MNSGNQILNSGLVQIAHQLREIVALSQHITFTHIHRGLNVDVDTLSKDSLLLPYAYFILEEFLTRDFLY
jgi:hypothetical protein